MPANGRGDLIRRLKVNETSKSRGEERGSVMVCSGDSVVPKYNIVAMMQSSLTNECTFINLKNTLKFTLKYT